MARQKQPALDTSILEPINAEAHAETLHENKIVAITENFNADRDLVNQLMGQAQAFQAVAKLTTVVSLSKLQYIKENKLYKATKGMKTADGQELSGTWDEFVESIGLSRTKVDEDLINLSTFGEDALDSLGRIGAGYRELRKLRKLPENLRQEIAGQLVNLEDKEEVVALIDDMISKHTTQTQALTKQVSDLTEDAKATEKIIQDKNEKIDSQERIIHKLQNKTSDWHPRAFEIAMEVTRRTAMALENLAALDTLRDAILNEDFGENADAAIEAMAVVYFDGVDQVHAKSIEVMHDCEQVFIGYKDQARPIMEVFGNPQDKTTH